MMLHEFQTKSLLNFNCEASAAASDTVEVDDDDDDKPCAEVPTDPAEPTDAASDLATPSFMCPVWSSFRHMRT